MAVAEVVAAVEAVAVAAVVAVAVVTHHTGRHQAVTHHTDQPQAVMAGAATSLMVEDIHLLLRGLAGTHRVDLVQEVQDPQAGGLLIIHHRQRDTHFPMPRSPSR